MLCPPVISLPDPLQEAEGSVDPLSLQRTYERLADRVFPAVTVRMSRIRFVAAMCLGARVCAEMDPDRVASDEASPPWLVYEWFVIEALARSGKDVAKQSIPGLQKVRACLDAQRPVSAATYLKTPKVFGFTGIFRRLATRAHIVTDELALDDGGWELLHAVEKDEDLPGLVDGGSGDGAALVRDLRDAVERGLEKGHTVPRRTEFWERVAAHLTPIRTGKHERKVILTRLRSSDGRTAQVVDDLLRGGRRLSRSEETSYLRGLASRVDAPLRSLLRAIDSYEALCRPITDAFTLVRHLSTRSGAVGSDDFANHDLGRSLPERTIEGCRRVAEDPALLDLEPDVRVLVDAFDDVRTAGDLFRAIVAHHEYAQKHKPPDGKRPWLERARGDRVLIRPAYQVDEISEEAAYVHDYRIATMCRFLADLGVFA